MIRANYSTEIVRTAKQQHLCDSLTRMKSTVFILLSSLFGCSSALPSEALEVGKITFLKIYIKDQDRHL